MDNQIAAPCCGSCKQLNDISGNCKEITGIDVLVSPNSLCYSCDGKRYSPRNPIPIISIPGVKELVEEACRDGFCQGLEHPVNPYTEPYANNYAHEYMKALTENNK